MKKAAIIVFIAFGFLSKMDIASANACGVYTRLKAQGVDVKFRTKDTKEACQAFNKLECARVTNLIGKAAGKLFDRWESQENLTLISQWNGRGSFSMNIARNTKYLYDKDTESWENLIDDINGIESEIPSITDINSLLDKYEKLSSIVSDGKARFETNFKEENRFLSQLREDLANLVWMINAIGNTRRYEGCDTPEVEELLNKLVESNTEALLTLETILAAQYIRVPFLDLVEANIQNLASDKFRENVTENAEQAIRSLRQTIIANELNKEIAAWWTKASVNGLTNRLDTRSLQITIPLRLLGQKLNQALAYKGQVEALPPSLGSLKSEMLSSLNSRIQQIETKFESVKQLDWSTQLRKQKEANERRMAAIDRYIPACKYAVEDHLRIANTVAAESQFATAEQAYLVVVESCKRG
ncbi:MAG: hypothetical protein HRU19_31465 [Pseudobacteriovorax sp.]|nr:hypothetical protein [Pseudobacteriovorax sp.]